MDTKLSPNMAYQDTILLQIITLTSCYSTVLLLSLLLHPYCSICTYQVLHILFDVRHPETEY